MLLTALLLARLIFSGLARVYIHFVLWLGFSLFRNTCILLIKFTPRQYSEYWLVTEVLSWCLAGLVVIEIGNLALGRFPGIRTWGRRAVVAVTSLSFLIFVVLTTQVPRVRYEGFFVVGSLAQAGLGVTLLLILVFLLWFPVPLSRNVALHTTLFAAYFFSKGAMFLWMAILRTQPLRSISMAVLVLACCCMTAWLLLLSRQGETVPLRPESSWSHAEEIRLVAQLEALAQKLDRPFADPSGAVQPPLPTRTPPR